MRPQNSESALLTESVAKKIVIVGRWTHEIEKSGTPSYNSGRANPSATQDKRNNMKSNSLIETRWHL